MGQILVLGDIGDTIVPRLSRCSSLHLRHGSSLTIHSPFPRYRYTRTIASTSLAIYPPRRVYHEVGNRGYGVSGKGGVELEALSLSLLMLARMGLETGLETLVPVLLFLVVGRLVEGRGLVLNLEVRRKTRFERRV